ncbi:MAG: hypothetical protein IJJ98_07260 [Prevotella sp.]|nr:hypothetical protein [Prevotella sp.]
MIRLLTMLCMMTALPMLAGNTNENRRRLLGASDENPVDATWLITNPSFETGDLTGWTTFCDATDYQGDGTDIEIAAHNENRYLITGMQGDWLFNAYHWWSGNLNISQVVANVPSGVYELSGIVCTWDGREVYLSGNGATVTATGVGDHTGIPVSVPVVVEADGVLSITVGSYAAWWIEGHEGETQTFFKLDDVRLTCKGLYENQELTSFTATALNVDGLPSLINNDGPGSNGTKLISTYLKNKGYDIIGISEDFEYHDELKSYMTGYSWGTYRGSVNVLNLFSPANTDGLEFAWNTNTVSVTNESWTQWSHSESGDGNQYIKKGFRHYDMTLDGGQVIDVYVLHMDAGDVVSSREQQWSQMADVINAADPNRPKLIIGDTNSRWTREDIGANFVNRLNGFSVGDPWVKFWRGGVFPKPGTGDLTDQSDPANLSNYEVVDKLLYLNPTYAEGALQLSPKYFRLEQDYTYGTVDGSGNTKALGDHRPAVAEFTLIKVDKLKFLLGDVNRDGSITIADLTAQVNLILGKDAQDASDYDRDAADMNADGEVTTKDIEPLVNLLLDK